MEKTHPSLFKKQLEEQAQKRIIYSVLLGCLAFCLPIFGLSYLQQNITMEEHLNFLTATYDQVYDEVISYLTAPDQQDLFRRNIRGEQSQSELHYSLFKHNVAGQVRLNLILLDQNKQITYTSFEADAMNLHRIEFNKIVAQNSLNSEKPIYTTVYYLSGERSESVISRPLYQNGDLVGFAVAYLNGHDWGKLLLKYQYDSIITNLEGSMIYYTKGVFLPERHGNKYRLTPGTSFITVQNSRYRVKARILADKDAILYSFVYSPGSTLYVVVGVGIIAFLGLIWLVMFKNLSRLMAAKNAESVDTLVKEIRILRRENNEHVIKLETDDEFEEIAIQINKMVKSLNDLNRHNTDLLRLNNLIEMRNLQTQINPHFIYNTLDTIKYLILSEPSKAVYLLEKFTHILRYSIDNTKKDVCLEEDLAYIEDYIFIHKVRFGERFRCMVQIDPGCGPALVPKLLLQPLIENSIKHGFRKQMELAILVTGWIMGDYIFLQVQDDGTGVSPEELKVLQQRIAAETIETAQCGLQNIARRIVLKYGSDCGLFIKSKSGESFTVTVKLPKGRLRNV